jgi:hypothetical protein
MTAPRGRGRWRFTLHHRSFAHDLTYDSTIISDLPGARSRRCEQQLNSPAKLTWSMDGTDPACMAIRELEHDVIAWRWDDDADADVPVFRGCVAQSQDSVSEQVHTVNFTAHDYLAILGRRLLDHRIVFTQWDQDDIVANFLHWGQLPTYGAAAVLPLRFHRVDPGGFDRAGKSGILRDRTYEPNQKLDEALANLGACESGYDLGVVPVPVGDDELRVFFPYQGELRVEEIVIEYGGAIASLSRSVNSVDYANYWRVIGKVPDGSPDGTLPPAAVAADVPDPILTPVGLWMSGDNASDVSQQGTLDQKARANLLHSTLVPSYSLGLRPGWYEWGKPRMGDTIRFLVRHGRLDVDSEVRVVGIAYDIGDDGEENVGLTVGRPDLIFSDLLSKLDRDINALARR